MLDPNGYTGTYKVIGGDLALDFANTVSWRYSDHPHDWLHDYPNLVRWGQLVGIVDDAQAAELIAAAATQDAARTAAILEQAKSLREAMQHIFMGLYRGQAAQDDDLAILNKALAHGLSHLNVGQGDGKFAWTWLTHSRTLDFPMWPVAWSAAQLLVAERWQRLGICEACQWLFLDTSKNHTRRWCTMDDCGNRAKVRRFREQESRLSTE